MNEKKKGQIWVETVIYTLIGLALIGIVLAIATPQINKLKEKRIVEQSIASLSEFDEKIKEDLESGKGNRRTIEFSLKKGEFYINGDQDTIVLILKDFTKPYSEPGAIIPQGSVFVKTEKVGKNYNIILLLNYSVINLTYTNKDISKKFTPTNLPYVFNIDNEGLVRSLIEISISETSGLGGVTRPGTENPTPSCDPSNCDDGNICTDDSCNSGVCKYVNNTAECVDGQCSNGVCAVNMCKDNDDLCPSQCYYINDDDCNYCGDGIKKSPNDGGEFDNSVVEEQCDDGNTNSNDGCSACVITDGWECVEDANGKSSCTQTYIPINACGNIVINNMNYFVKNNLKNLDIEGVMQTICLKIIANNITIDFDGYNITHENGATDAVGISIENTKKVIIKNVSILKGDSYRFARGIEITNSDNVTILSSEIKGNQPTNLGNSVQAGGINIINGRGIILKNNQIVNNHNCGIKTNSQEIILENNYICYSGYTGKMDICCSGGDFKGSNNIIGGSGNHRNEGICSFSELTNTNNDCSVQPQSSPILEGPPNNTH